MLYGAESQSNILTPAPTPPPKKTKIQTKKTKNNNQAKTKQNKQQATSNKIIVWRPEEMAYVSWERMKGILVLPPLSPFLTAIGLHTERNK